MSMIAAPANAMSSTFSAGSSNSLTPKKFVSTLDFLDPNSKESVLKFIKIDCKNYFNASRKLQMNKEVIHAACDMDNYVFSAMEGKAKIIAMKYISQLPPTKYEIYE